MHIFVKRGFFQHLRSRSIRMEGYAICLIFAPFRFCNHVYRASPKICNPPLFPLLLQTSLSNIKNDFMVKKNDILEINCYSFNQIRSSMSKLWGNVWHLYHFTPTQCKTYGEDWFWVSSQSRMLNIAASFACSVCSHAWEIYLLL